MSDTAHATDVWTEGDPTPPVQLEPAPPAKTEPAKTEAPATVEPAKTEAPATVEPTEPVTPADEDQVASLAAKMGWKPDGVGRDGQTKTAEQFILDSQRITSDLSAKLRTQEAETKQRFDRMEQANRAALERARQNIIDQYEAQKREAVIQTDPDTYDQAENRMREELANFDKKLEPDPKQEAVPQYSPDDQFAIAKFEMENSWYNSDPVMTGAANQLSADVAQKYPGLPVAQALELVMTGMKQSFPAKFGATTPKPKAPTVEGGLKAINTGPDNSFDTIEFGEGEKTSVIKMLKDPMYGFDKDFEKAKAQYARDYFAEEK